MLKIIIACQSFPSKLHSTSLITIFLFCSMGWFRRHCLYVYPWSFKQCDNQSSWLSSNCLSWCSAMHWQSFALTPRFTNYSFVCDLQCSIWVWEQLPVCLMLCDNVPVLSQEASSSYWYSCIRNWNRSICFSTNSSILVECL